MNSAVDIAMTMLYLVAAYLVLTNFNGFTAILDSAGSNWRKTLLILQGR